MNETSLDRKMARCAREIEAAKPKGLSFDDFRFLNHDIKGAAPESKSAYAGTLSRPASTDAAPPSKFKVGDRIRPAYKSAGWTESVVTLVLHNSVVFWIDGNEWLDVFNDVELIPPEPKAEDGGWIAHKPGDPMPVDGSVVVHCKIWDGEPSPAPAQPARVWLWDQAVTGYRVLK